MGLVPLVIAHRGASGYRPENTLEAFELGLEQGADGIEFDLVVTKDEQLVVRHENALSGTTDVSSHLEFTDRRRSGFLESLQVADWFVEDFTLTEIKSLRAIERLPELRPGSKKFDCQFEIPSFKEVLASSASEKMLVVELKAGSHLNHLSESLAQLLLGDLLSAKPVKNLVIESFNRQLLLEAKALLSSAGISAEYYFLLEHGDFSEVTELFWQINGISISLEMLFGDADWVSFAHENSLQIWAYTARAEDATTSIEAYYEEIIGTGVDGIFADQPDLLRRVIADSRGSAYDY